MEFTGYYDIKGEKIYVGDYLKHRHEGIEGFVKKVDKEWKYEFGDGFELVNYGAEVEKVIISHLD